MSLILPDPLEPPNWGGKLNAALNQLNAAFTTLSDRVSALEGTTYPSLTRYPSTTLYPAAA